MSAAECTPAQGEQIEYRDNSPLSMPQVIVGRAWPDYAEIRASMASATVEATS